MSKRKAKPISADEFAAWRADPVTRWAMGELAKAAEAQRVAWLNQSWGDGVADPLLLAVLKTRADAYAALAEMTYEDLAEMPE